MNDVKNVKRYLIDRGFPDDTYNMVVLSEDAENPAFIPTGQNMLAAMNWLVSQRL